MDTMAIDRCRIQGALMRHRTGSAAAFLAICALTLPNTSLAQSESLLIGPGDLVQVDVLDTPEMEQQVRVTDSGSVSLAYIGDIHLAGETPSQAAANIQAA